jgi:hypothetical protein
MLDEGSSTNPVPVFVADGRRRHHAVRLLGATLGLLLAGWLAALATGIVGFGALPALPLPGGGSSNTAPATHPDPVPAGPSGAAQPAIQRQSQVVHKSSSPGGSHGAATARGTSGSSSGSATTAPGGSARGSTTPPSGSGTGSATTPPSGTGTGSTTPPTGTGGGSQSNSGNEPAWTPPSTGTKGADPPRGNSSSAPGSTVSAGAPGQSKRPSG